MGAESAGAAGCAAESGGTEDGGIWVPSAGGGVWARATPAPAGTCNNTGANSAAKKRGEVQRGSLGCLLISGLQGARGLKDDDAGGTVTALPARKAHTLTSPGAKLDPPPNLHEAGTKQLMKLLPPARLC